MPLILAVEPNPLRLAHVTSLTRGRRRTDLLIAESVRGALSTIAARAPDVLLLSPEVSAEDRTRITDSLRAHGEVGARVMVFTTPQPKVSGESRTPSLPDRGSTNRAGPVLQHHVADHGNRTPGRGEVVCPVHTDDHEFLSEDAHGLLGGLD